MHLQGLNVPSLGREELVHNLAKSKNEQRAIGLLAQLSPGGLGIHSLQRGSRTGAPQPAALLPARLKLPGSGSQKRE